MSEPTEYKVTEQEKLWTGEFGDDYLERNQIEPRVRIKFWADILGKTNLSTNSKILEVGCSRGHNLIALRKCGMRILVGIDVNKKAVKEAREGGTLVLHGSHVLAPVFGQAFDLVFTAGVLIHIGPEEIEDAMLCISMATKKYLLAIEYEDDYETEVLYRGHNNALWRRPYGELYGKLGFGVIDTGDLKPEDGFDNCRFWLMERK